MSKERPFRQLWNLLQEQDAKRIADAVAFSNHNPELCMLCGAEGADKRSLFIDCFYTVDEVVPEALDISATSETQLPRHRSGYYLRICKSCRGSLLGKLSDWRQERVMLRHKVKDHDGYLLGVGEGCGDSERTSLFGRMGWW